MKLPFVVMSRKAHDFSVRRLNHTREANATLRSDNAALRQTVTELNRYNDALSDRLMLMDAENGQSDVELTQAICRLESLADPDADE